MKLDFFVEVLREQLKLINCGISGATGIKGSQIYNDYGDICQGSSSRILEEKSIKRELQNTYFSYRYTITSDPYVSVDNTLDNFLS